MLGGQETVGSLTREDLLRFIGCTYTPDRMIVSAAGNVDHDQVVAAVAHAHGDGQMRADPSEEDGPPEPPPPEPSFTSTFVQKDCEQAYFCLGTEGYPRGHADYPVLSLLSCCLGGGASSRLFQEIREKRGLAYAIGCYSTASHRTGSFVLYGITQPPALEPVLELSAGELAKVRAGDISSEELAEAKQQLIGGIHLSMDSVGARARRLALSQFIHDRVVPVDEVIAKIERVTQEDLVRVANRLLVDDHMAMATLGPFEGEGPQKPVIGG